MWRLAHFSIVGRRRTNIPDGVYVKRIALPRPKTEDFLTFLDLLRPTLEPVIEERWPGAIPENSIANRCWRPILN
jgi:hypothetical protein